MRLKRIEIENFKGVGKRQIIDLRSITLLFGANSSGKSTILQALHYAREIIERRNPDPDHTIAGGLIDLGGFKALVHNHEFDRAITIKLVIDLSEAQGSDRLQLNSGSSLGDTEFANLNIRYIVGENTDLKDYAVVQEVGVEIEVRWSELLAATYVSRLAVEMDGASVVSLKSPPQDGRAILTDFNFSHPLFQRIDEEEDLDGVDTAPDHEGSFDSPLANEILDLSRDMAKGAAALESRDFRVSVATVRGALPDLDRPLSSELRDADVKKFEMESSTPRVRGLEELLDELLLGPMRIARDYLNTMTYIGPLRDIPARSFRPRQSPDDSRWAQGLAAWDSVYTDNRGDLLSAVNLWLSGEDKLRTGYRLEKVSFREIAVPGRMNTLFERGLTEDDLGELQELYEGLERRVDIGLRDFEKGILVAPSDVGVGISQMIPVVVGCLVKGVGLLAIEQPELHIHPGVQVGMGDLFIRAIGLTDSGLPTGKSLLIETHSEHIMLRLLRRIRETTAGELPPGAPAMNLEALSVIYVEGSDEGIQFRQLRIDEEGEFRDQWPNGFFEERAGELF